MNTSEEKNRKKRLLAEFRRKQKEDFLNGLPMSLENFAALFDFLDQQLEQNGCDHSLTLTNSYLDKLNIERDIVNLWLEENGGYCDCEVLANVEEKFEDI